MYKYISFQISCRIIKLIIGTSIGKLLFIELELNGVHAVVFKERISVHCLQSGINDIDIKGILHH